MSNFIEKYNKEDITLYKVMVEEIVPITDNLYNIRAQYGPEEKTIFFGVWKNSLKSIDNINELNDYYKGKSLMCKLSKHGYFNKDNQFATSLMAKFIAFDNNNHKSSIYKLVNARGVIVDKKENKVLLRHFPGSKGLTYTTWYTISEDIVINSEIGSTVFIMSINDKVESISVLYNKRETDIRVEFLQKKLGQNKTIEKKSIEVKKPKENKKENVFDFGDNLLPF